MVRAQVIVIFQEKEIPEVRAYRETLYPTSVQFIYFFYSVQISLRIARSILNYDTHTSLAIGYVVFYY